MSQSIFLAELDPLGAHVRSARFGAGEAIEQRYIGVAAGKGSIALAGGWKTTLDFGGGALDPHGELDAFVARFAEQPGWGARTREQR